VLLLLQVVLQLLQCICSLHVTALLLPSVRVIFCAFTQ
jgi:hypothetical protein